MVSSAKPGFTITYNRLSAENEVILYMKHVEIILDSHVDEIIEGERAPAFFYHIEGRDAAGVHHAYDVMVQTDAASGDGTNKAAGLFAGTYNVSQTPVSRYVPGNAQAISHAAGIGTNASVDVLNHSSAEVLFPYSIRQMGGFGSMDSRANQLRK